MLKSRNVVKYFYRQKHGKNHWSVVEKKIFTKDRALQNFDDFYTNVYGIRWKSMRLGLLSKQKYIAMVNNFGEDEKVSAMFERDGAINIRTLYEVTKRNLEDENGKFYVDENYANNAMGHDSKMDNIFQKKRSEEITGIYADKEHAENVEVPKLREDIDSDRESDDENDVMEEVKKFKRPLEQAMREDSAIDHSRIIDPNFVQSALYEYVPATRIKGLEDFVPESEHYRYYSSSADFPLKVEMETEFSIPENLQMYTYEMGNITDFRIPFKTITAVSSHFLMNGSSILPPLALNLKPGDVVFDACAAPGGKSFLMLQTLLPKLLVSNDVMESRANKIRKLMQEFVYDFKSSWKNHRCIVREEDARITSEYAAYDKVLVDVPCTTDRHSVNENDNNIFKPTRIKERLRIPELQSQILSNCIRLLKPGGDLVYSTCSLSPIQNDGVIHMALSNVFKEHGISVTIKDLSMVMRPFQSIFKFEHPKGLKYGQMVLPYLPANFGPLYFCKMTRN
ncbi:5-methylcytosine rRNA methyltransferase NSUN4 [Chironomus tepperi]|uniref:5-methylcytosine rRNA methyltransferase NSUN4 n=1 Tax=Chironomus tepperi TaxID=113505 RepID=UPI00391F7582